MPPRPPTSSRAALGFVDRARIDRLLTPLVADADDRAFVLRCLLEEGPHHHRGANYVLLELVGALAESRSAAPVGPSVAVPMRLPPHLEEEHGDADYPIRLPVTALGELAGGDPARLAAMVDCLTDGPPQHALANVVLVALLDRLRPAREEG